MTNRSITIRNVYVMMAYAFRAIRSEGNDRIAAESFDHLHDLFAEILVRGVGTQVKRGLHRGYLQRSDALATVRGRIDITRTAATRSTIRGRLVCEFDEYEPDTPHNQALKSVIVLLIRHGDVAAPRRDALRRLLPYLEAVTLIAPTSIRWDALTYHRANATYRLLLGVCELIVRGLLPTQDTGSTRLTSWVSDDAMSSLYERFLREYYTVHHPELSPPRIYRQLGLRRRLRPWSQATPGDAHRCHTPGWTTRTHHRCEVLRSVDAGRQVGQDDRPLSQSVPTADVREERRREARRLGQRAIALRAHRST